MTATMARSTVRCRALRSLLPMLCALLAVACAHAGSRGAAPAPDGPLAAARQLLVVRIDSWESSTGTLLAFARDGRGEWRATGLATPVSIGRAGAAWGDGLHPPQADGPRKHEGDGRSPAGVFALGSAFGYADSDSTALQYAAMRASHWCMDVPASPLYNRIVDADDVGAAAVQGSTEPMRLDLHGDGDQRYRLGFVILHNQAARPGAGSCIFAHLWGAPGQPTAGCTAMDPRAMRALLDWLDPAARPRLLLLPAAEYARLRGDWQLPQLPLQ